MTRVLRGFRRRRPAARDAQRRAMSPRPATLILNFFIVLHLVAIGLWSLPPWPLRDALVEPFKPYMLCSGLWQGWDMFSPKPLSINFHLDAEIAFADGSQKTWTFPRMERLGFAVRYQKERYRKWIELVRQDAFAFVWPDTARYIARLHADPANPPETVVLTRHWAEIPPPTRASFQPILPQFDHDNAYTFFTYQVSPEDFR